MSCDWETVKNVVPGNSSTKPDQTGGDGKERNKLLILLAVPAVLAVILLVLPAVLAVLLLVLLVLLTSQSYGKGVKQSKMFNYSVYSRLGNNVNFLFIYLYNGKSAPLASHLRSSAVCVHVLFLFLYNLLRLYFAALATKCRR